MLKNSFSLILLVTYCLLIVGCSKDIPKSETIDSLLKKEFIQDDDFYNVVESKHIRIDKVKSISNEAKKALLVNIQSLTDQTILQKQPYFDKNAIEDFEFVLDESSAQQSNFKAAAPCTFRKIISVPHYYEFNTAQNPNGYYWCGHTCLKCVGTFHGTTKTLQTIHNTFWNNAATYRNNRCTGGSSMYCANLWDIEQGAKLSQNGGYGWSATSMETISSVSQFYQRLKDGVDFNRPTIVPSTYIYSVGHFYIVMGYDQICNSNGTIDFNASKVYLRDVAMQTPGTTIDRSTSVQNFYNFRSGNQILFVRP